jgi:catechol-2,3-dioxygenase
MTEFAGVAHLQINVRDLERSAAWYQQVLGFAVVERDEGRVALYSPPARLGLALQQSDAIGGPDARDGQILDHLALYVRDRGALDGWQERLASIGIEASIDDAGFGWSISVFDPDGTEMELFTPKREATAGT